MYLKEYQSSPSLTILVPLWPIVICMCFFYLSTLLVLGFLQFKSSFVRVQNKQAVGNRPISSVTLHHVILRTGGQPNVNKSLDSTTRYDRREG